MLQNQFWHDFYSGEKLEKHKDNKLTVEWMRKVLASKLPDQDFVETPQCDHPMKLKLKDFYKEKK